MPQRFSLSNRISKIEESGTFSINEIAVNLKNQGKDVINLSVGEPDFNTPSHIIEAATKAMYDGHTHYTSMAGIPELKSAIAKKFKENDIDVESNEVIVTAGAKQAIFEVALTVLDKGDEAILFDPAWVSYKQCINFVGAKTVWAKTDENFIPYDFTELVNNNTKLIVLNSPCNPTGVVYGKDTLNMISDIAKDHDILVLSDEIYEKILYNGTHLSIGSFDGMENRTITVNGFSKAYAMTGWRLGYATAPPDILNGMHKIQQHSTSCANSFAQYGALEALNASQKATHDMLDEFKERRDILVDGFNSMGVKCETPAGAFYLFVDVSQFNTNVSDNLFIGDVIANTLLNNGFVATVPGSVFGPDSGNYIRISYAISKERISEALDRIDAVFNL